MKALALGIIKAQTCD
ncbi:Putative uncharacterized protein [Lactococcus lactis subsp. lactis A12]|uniref:Uncharacterized protein n=1 Tax=Lactococcus lactis subsp. lactis A12 TaxID=1137134 RepID=S6F7C4_LACLL|nr:Putative uncharacterized protein [Lactococcus lactis subsp. lactis A12]SBW31368.1 Hypothetical protein LLA12_02223 [Lactococcus lactis subsp. lactis]